MAEAGIQPTNCRLVFKKRLWLPREDFSSDAFTSLVYHQLLPTYLRGVLRCPVEDPEERMQEVAFLAALQYKASGEDQRRNTNHAYGEREPGQVLVVVAMRRADGGTFLVHGWVGLQRDLPGLHSRVPVHAKA